MLIKLNISNFAVFENESIEFSNGFNVFTGETGSGKSVLIEAISIILGDRASKDLIRKGKKSALIEAIFDTDNILNSILNNIGIEVEEDDYLILSREILENGKSINKINNRIVPLSSFKEVGKNLIDIYGQFGNESLFKKENHIQLLDSLIYKDISQLLDPYKKLLKNYQENKANIEFIQDKLKNKDLKIEQLQYEIDEIDNAKLKEQEEDELLKEIKKLSNVQEIKNSLLEAQSIISKGNSINNAYSIINKVKNFDEKIEEYLKRLDLLIEELQFIIIDLKSYSEKLDYDESKLIFIEDRMSTINRLKRKYGFTLEKILEYKESSKVELDLLKDAEYKQSVLIKENEALNKELIQLSKQISIHRKNAAKLLEKKILVELDDLNMKNIKFIVKIEEKDNFSDNGKDDVEFLISTNVGSDLNSVQKVVSGGEASRIMLALKKINSDIDEAQTLVFDEIDAGISGKTSQMAGQKMNYISNKHQVICVTHSPQIASISKNHFLIEKNVRDNNTYSTVKILENEDRINEIARLLSGMKITEKSISNAIELIEFNSSLSED